MILNLPAPGNWDREMNFRTQPAPGNWSEVKTSKAVGQIWSSTTSKSLTIATLRKSSKNLRKRWKLVEDSPMIGIEALKTKVWIWASFTTMMKAIIHLGPTYQDERETDGAVHWNSLDPKFAESI